MKRFTVVPLSSFTRGQYHPTISHGVDDSGERTLCGRACSDWIRNEPSPWQVPLDPDCLVCRRVMRKNKERKP